VRQLQAHPLHRGGAGLSEGAAHPPPPATPPNPPTPPNGEPDSAAAQLAAIRERMAAACGRAGRNAAAVELVGASKVQPAAKLVPFLAAGLRLLGENRVQEAAAKQRELAELGALAAPPGPPVVWHLIGPLQSNKVRQALELFSCLHALDRTSIAAAVDREAARRGIVVTGLLEVNVAGEESKHGFPAAGLAAAVRPLADLANLRIAGLMAIPPQAASPAAARPWFRRLRELRDELGGRAEWSGWAGWLSMGMSEDFEVAIEEGATHVRIGTALFGRRPAPAAGPLA
jgi:pyridoxal phosphate enzyme (YggS family)